MPGSAWPPCWPGPAASRPPTSTRSPTPIAALSRLAGDLGDLLDALDINPLICGPSGAVAADVLAVTPP